MGLAGFEPATSRLSSVRSNQLSYKPGQTEYRASWAPGEVGVDVVAKIVGVHVAIEVDVGVDRCGECRKIQVDEVAKIVGSRLPSPLKSAPQMGGWV